MGSPSVGGGGEGQETRTGQGVRARVCALVSTGLKRGVEAGVRYRQRKKEQTAHRPFRRGSSAGRLRFRLVTILSKKLLNPVGIQRDIGHHPLHLGGPGKDEFNDLCECMCNCRGACGCVWLVIRAQIPGKKQLVPHDCNAVSTTEFRETNIARWGTHRRTHIRARPHRSSIARHTTRGSGTCRNRRRTVLGAQQLQQITREGISHAFSFLPFACLRVSDLDRYIRTQVVPSHEHKVLEARPKPGPGRASFFWWVGGDTGPCTGLCTGACTGRDRGGYRRW